MGSSKTCNHKWGSQWQNFKKPCSRSTIIFSTIFQICRCLPGYCTCGKEHYTFKKDTETEDFGMGFRPLQVDKLVPSTKEEREKAKEINQKKEGDVSEVSSVSLSNNIIMNIVNILFVINFLWLPTLKIHSVLVFFWWHDEFKLSRLYYWHFIIFLL